LFKRDLYAQTPDGKGSHSMGRTDQFPDQVDLGVKILGDEFGKAGHKGSPLSLYDSG
jgi:hypothetical protein